MTGSTNAVIYRCPSCNDVVIVVPPGFDEPDEATVEAKASEHMQRHSLIRQIVEGNQ